MKDTKPYLTPEEEEKPKTLEDEIECLRKENEGYRRDNIYKLFFSINRKASEIADGLNENALDIKADDKVFDRFIKLMEKLEPFTKTLATLRQEYLKIPEEEVAELEKKGVPYIEQKIKQKNRGK